MCRPSYGRQPLLEQQDRSCCKQLLLLHQEQKREQGTHGELDRQTCIHQGSQKLHYASASR